MRLLVWIVFLCVCKIAGGQELVSVEDSSMLKSEGQLTDSIQPSFIQTIDNYYLQWLQN